MRKIKVEIQPNGNPEAIVPVEPRTHDSPMTATIDLDALRDTVARMKNPAYDPDAVVDTIRCKIAAGVVDRLYTAMIDEYVTIAATETGGDVFGFIEMEFLALRRIMDEETPDFRPDLHEDMLSAALSFKVNMRLPIEGRAGGGKRRPTLDLELPTPLLRKRNDALNAIRIAILAAANRARRIGSDSYRLWRDALEVVAMKRFTAGGAMAQKDVKHLIESLRAANTMLFLDAAIADYVPLDATEDGGKEDGDVF